MRAAAPSGGSGYCACHCRERGGPSGDNGGPAATTRAAGPSERSGWSGVEWSGVEWSGVEWSGVEWSGVEWSGVEW